LFRKPPSVNLRKMVLGVIVFSCFWNKELKAQVQVEATVNGLPEARLFEVDQDLNYTNTAADTLQVLYLNDWNNAFASRDSPLARQFGLEYKRRFHFSNSEERGFTKLVALTNERGDAIPWERPEGIPDNIKINLEKPLIPGDSLSIKLNYVLRIPEDQFTGFGVDENGNFDFRNWLILPAVYQNVWQNYSHKNLNDSYYPLTNLRVTLNIPEQYHLLSEFDQSLVEQKEYRKTFVLQGERTTNFEIALYRDISFYRMDAGRLEIISNLGDEGLPDTVKTQIAQKIVAYLGDNLGEYPHRKILITDAAYRKNPIYGLNQLPSFVRPFSSAFQYELKLAKTMIHQYIASSIQIQPRRESWFREGLEIYLLMKYVDTYYPKMKLIGKLSKAVGIRWSQHYNSLKMTMNATFRYGAFCLASAKSTHAMRKWGCVSYASMCTRCMPPTILHV